MTTNNKTTTDRQDVYTRITSSIIKSLEEGVRPWTKPWNAGGSVTRPLRHNRLPYSGINVLILWTEAAERGFTSPFWMTFKQALEFNACVKKGEKGTLIVYANTFMRVEEDKDGHEVERSIPFLRGYTVFNACQIRGLPEHFYVSPAPPRATFERIESAEKFFAATGASIRYGGNRAFYQESGDFIQMPQMENFPDAECFMSVLGHETVHWTKPVNRLARDFGKKVWGDEGYAREELVAELGAAFLCADLGIANEVRDDHAAYIGSWLKVLHGDKRAIFQAAAHAQRAVDFLHGFQALPVQHEAAA